MRTIRDSSLRRFDVILEKITSADHAGEAGFGWALLVALCLGALLLLGAIHALLGLIWFGCLIIATRPLARFLEKPSVVQSCDRLTGGMFMAFGVGLALQSRRV